ncbi:integrase [Gossypium australe]|uniref:Integrase n=1 Tax=Gossypium australe TaxID=47621 RepID=A0A5B6VDG0_9ROSI|nr:integrase [Gossypium australe]
MYFRNRLCVPDSSRPKQDILLEAHSSTYSIHPGMKHEILEFVTKCLVCQQVKAKHQVPSGLLQRITILEWKWERVTMDFLLSLPVTPRKKDSI